MGAGKRFFGAAVVLAAVASVAWGYPLWRHGDVLSPGAVCDRVVLVKHERRLTLYRRGRPLKTYRVALGRNPVGPKRMQGDKKIPEGRYTITHRHPSRSFYKSLHGSYPSPGELAYAKAHGIKDPGGLIKIHGPPPVLAWLDGLHRLRDWTAGCIALTNREMDELRPLSSKWVSILRN